ncbi:hypothetical protein [Halovivax gelatinilyticus]|uniref:hypothetical protein n=1 Tax=Halovivax gelatinilyticus TaxID=2961597 RepID=UPI0020CA4915|nr:hypothetical protein [Halovivax gelatinilyticus]
MSAQQHRTSRTVERGESLPDDAERSVLRVAPVEDVDEGRPGLAAEIERTQLRVTVSALARELEARERRHAEIVHRYEQVLADRSADESDRPSRSRRSRLTRLLVPGE